jgi:hypothetical protein
MIMRPASRLVTALLVIPALAHAQRSLADRIHAAGTRTIAFSARSRPEVCGDGVNSFADGLSGPRTRVFDGMLLTYSAWDTRITPCDPGPVRVTVRVVDGTPSWIRVAAGPLPVLGDSVQEFGTVSTTEAGDFLRVLARGEGRVANQALMPLVLLDSVPRWQILTAAARDTTRMLTYRRRAADLLARAAASTIAVDATSDEDASNIRREAVNALARREQKNQDPVPELLDIARTNSHRDARVAALYQLGQYADPRAVDLFASMLSAKL